MKQRSVHSLAKEAESESASVEEGEDIVALGVESHEPVISVAPSVDEAPEKLSINDLEWFLPTLSCN